MQTVNLFGIHIDNVFLLDAVDMIVGAVKSNEKKKVYFVNADCFNIMHRDGPYYEAVREGDFVFGDGSGVRLAGRITGQPVRDNVNGTDLLPALTERCAAEGLSLFLLGAKPGVASRMADHLTTSYPGLKIAGTHHGFFDRARDNDDVLAMINASKADILLVAFGAPLQERWIDAHMPALDCAVAVGVGGLFDFFSGDMPRAPRWMRKAGLEWMYRLMQEPNRMWRRYVIGNPLFVYRVVAWTLKGRGDLQRRTAD